MIALVVVVMLVAATLVWNQAIFAILAGVLALVAVVVRVRRMRVARH